MTKVSRFVIWICSKFTKEQIQLIIQELSDILNNRNPDVKPKDDFKQKHPNYQNFFVDPKPPIIQHHEPPNTKPHFMHILSVYFSKHGHNLSPVSLKKTLLLKSHLILFVMSALLLLNISISIMV